MWSHRMMAAAVRPALGQVGQVVRGALAGASWLPAAPTLMRPLSGLTPVDTPGGAGGGEVDGAALASAPTRAAVPDLALALETLTPREVVSQLDRVGGALSKLCLLAHTMQCVGLSCVLPTLRG